MVEIFVLGTIQDGGLPQIGCSCLNCKDVIKSDIKTKFRSCLALKSDNSIYIIDATPDFKEQYLLLSSLIGKDISLSGIVLTHLHIGHYTGLMYLGKESMSSKDFPVYMTKEVCKFLRSNKPFSYLIERNEIKPYLIDFAKFFLEIDDVKISAFEVPHRNEDGNTIGINVKNRASGKSLLYIPDIDYLSPDLKENFSSSNIVIFDGTFFSKNELSRQELVPHPPIKETIDFLGPNFHRNFYFTHFNHTNPVLNSSSKEYVFTSKSGYKLASEKNIFSL